MGRANNKRRFFGSGIQESEFISLSIWEAELYRDRLRSWHQPCKKIIDLGLTHSQLGLMLGSVGISEGIPCTILHRNGERIDQPPELNDIDLSMEESKAELRDASKKIRTSMSRVEEILDKKGSPKKDEKQEIKRSFDELARLVESKFEFMINKIEESGERMKEQAYNAAQGLIKREFEVRGIPLGSVNTHLLEG
jgi:ElaB/YqjD/DUF883 family membrane-anchored ribosome-binding protein